MEASLLLIGDNLVVEMDGSGNVMEVDECRGLGSGGLYAECAALALMREGTNQGVDEIGRKAMRIASQKCVYTSFEYVERSVESKGGL